MKHSFKHYIGAVLLTALVALNVQAQDTAFKTLPPVTVTPKTVVSKEITSSFRSIFPDAENEVWYKADRNYLVRFITKDQTNRALFKKNGELIYHIRYGNESNLPKDVLDIVKRQYHDYNVTGVIFVNQDNRNIWLVNVEDSKRLLVLRVEEGELERVETLNKS